VFQMLDAGKGGPHIGSAILRGGGNSQGKQKESKTVSHFKPLQTRMEDRGNDNRPGVALKHFLCQGRTSI
jgi:hypothetical protein